MTTKTTTMTMKAPLGIPQSWNLMVRNPRNVVSQVMQSHPDDTFSDKTKHITDPQDRGPQKMALVSKQEFCFGLTGNG